MKILYVAGFTGPEFIQKFCKGTEPHLAATQKIKTICRAFLLKGHEIDMVSSGVTTVGNNITSFKEEMVFDEGIVNIHYSSIFGYRGFGFINNLKTYKLFKKKLKEKKYDIVISCNITELTYLTLRKAKKIGIKTILEYEDHPLAHIKNNSGFNAKVKYFIWLLNKITVIVHSLIVVSLDLIPKNFNKEWLLLQGALSDDISLRSIDNGIKKVPSEPLQIVYTGGLEITKGVMLLFSMLKYMDIAILLHIVGDGPLKENLLKCQNELNGIKKMKVYGYLNRSEMLDCLFNADILINPHLMNNDNSMVGKVFPFKMIEYCASGVPVISSNVGKFNTFLDSYLTLYNEDSAEVLSAKIKEVVLNYSDAITKAKELQKVILKQYSLQGISEQLNIFIKK